MILLKKGEWGGTFTYTQYIFALLKCLKKHILQLISMLWLLVLKHMYSFKMYQVQCKKYNDSNDLSILHF